MGKVVLFDRYPMSEFKNMKEPMDGPRIKRENYWQKRELHYYTNIKNPDYIFILKVTKKNAIQRKKEHDSLQKEEMIQSKIEAINNLPNDLNNNWLFIDSNCDQKETLNRIKKIIWDVI